MDDRNHRDLARLLECVFGGGRDPSLLVRMDRLERAAEDVPGLRAEHRTFTRELEAFEKIVHAHVVAIGHGDRPVVIDASTVAAITDHLADQVRHEERRRSVFRVLGGGAGQLFELGLRILQIVILAYVAARLGLPGGGP